MDLKNKKGFTLIELLIVMMIVGVLAMLAINGYSQYRRSALLDLSTDNFVSQIYELRERSIRGDFGDEKYQEILSRLEEGETEEMNEEEVLSISKCFGFYFEESEDGFSPMSFEQEFLGKKSWNVVLNDWDYLGCGNINPLELESRKFELDEELKIVDSSGYFGDLANLYIRFLPPSGEIQISTDGGLDFNDANSEEITFVLKYGVSDEAYYKRKVLFNLDTARLSVSRFD